MGTRHLTCAVIDGVMKVAQYGQWDGYLEGQGQILVDFITQLTKSDMRAFKANVRKCTWIDEKEVDKRMKSVGSTDGWMTLDQSNKWKENWPELSRDTGGDIFSLILNEPKELQDGHEFAADSLFCEWAYVLDLDRNTLEIYRGFQTKPHKAGRFHKLDSHQERRGDEQYYPVKLVKKLKFAGLPESFKAYQEEYAKQCEEDDED